MRSNDLLLAHIAEGEAAAGRVRQTTALPAVVDKDDVPKYSNLTYHTDTTMWNVPTKTTTTTSMFRSVTTVASVPSVSRISRIILP